MKSLQLWQKVGLVRVTFFRQCPGAELRYLGRRPGDCCALFFRVRGLAVRQSAASAGVLQPESAMSSCPTTHKLTDNTGYDEVHFCWRKAWISRKYSTASGETSHRAGHCRSARRKGAVLGVCAGAISASEANYPNVQIRQPGHDSLIQTRLVFCQM